jgi:hypothetical protein
MALIHLYNSSNTEECILPNYKDNTHHLYNYEKLFRINTNFAYSKLGTPYGNIITIDIRNTSYKNGNTEHPFTVWQQRTYGSQEHSNNIVNDDVRSSYKIVSLLKNKKTFDKGEEQYYTLKNSNTDEIYVYINYTKNKDTYDFHYDNNNYEQIVYELTTLNQELQSNIFSLNTYLKNMYGENFNKEALYNYIYYDISEHSLLQPCNSEKEMFMRKWKVHKYEKGGFFIPHTDTQINQDHIGTLVLIPPKTYSEYSGGKLVLYNMENPDMVDMEIEQPEEGWVCVFIRIGQKHEITEVLEGTRYSFTSPYFITNITKLNMKNTIYTESYNEEKLKDNLYKTNMENTLQKIEVIEKEIQDLMTKKKELEDYLNKKNELYNMTLETAQNMEKFKQKMLNKVNSKKGFIVVLKKQYVNPCPTNLIVDDIIQYNTIFDISKTQNVVPKIRFLNTDIHIDAGCGLDDIEDVTGDIDSNKIWGFDKDIYNMYDDDDNNKLSFSRDMIDGLHLESLKASTLSYELDQYNQKVLYYEYLKYQCFYNYDSMPEDCYTSSEYNDEYYMFNKELKVTCMIVEFE